METTIADHQGITRMVYQSGLYDHYSGELHAYIQRLRDMKRDERLALCLHTIAHLSKTVASLSRLDPPAKGLAPLQAQVINPKP
jgi:hypothetical protein